MISEILIPISWAFMFAILVTAIILHALSDHEDDYEEEDDGNDEH